MKIKSIALACASLALSGSLFSHPLYKDTTIVTQQYEDPHRFELGLLMGDMKSSRTVFVDGLFDSTRGSKSKNDFEIGIQGKLFLNPIHELQTFIYANAALISNSSYTLFDEVIFPFTTNNSIIKFHTGFVARLGVGFETDPFNNFTASIGGGVAVLNQRLDSSINEITLTTPGSVSNNSIAPTLMGSLNYRLCAHCISGHPFILAAQLTGDQYPHLLLNTQTLFGITRANLHASWQYHIDAVFSTKF